MCVAICIPAGVKTPSIETLKHCWDHNPHGAGFAYNDLSSGKVKFHKGFMKWEDFEHAFMKVCKVDAMTDNTRFIHFRITSKGTTCPENTHPFPISSNVNDLKILDGYCDEIMFHNGTFTSLDISEKDISDTMEMAMWVARLKLTSQGLTMLGKFLKPFISSNKVGFLKGDGEHVLVGSWSEIDGVYYSNTYWKPTQYTYNYATHTNTKTTNYNQYTGYPYTSKIGYTDWDEYEYDCWGYNNSNKKESRFQEKEEIKKDETEVNDDAFSLAKSNVIIDTNRVYKVADTLDDIIALFDMYCPDCANKNKHALNYVEFVGKYTSKEYESDPVLYCADCDTYFLVPLSNMTLSEITDIADYLMDYYDYNGELEDFWDYFECGLGVEKDDDKIIDAEVVEVKQESKDETKEPETKEVPVKSIFNKVIDTIKSKKVFK